MAGGQREELTAMKKKTQKQVYILTDHTGDVLDLMEVSKMFCILSQVSGRVIICGIYNEGAIF